MSRKAWVLDTDTKGTGANMVPLEKVVERRAGDAEPPRSRRPVPPAEPRRAQRQGQRRPSKPAERTSTPLPPGHVRKRDTGEIGKVQAVDSKAGTATVLWLRRGSTSTVPLAAISRR